MRDGISVKAVTNQDTTQAHFPLLTEWSDSDSDDSEEAGPRGFRKARSDCLKCRSRDDARTEVGRPVTDQSSHADINWNG
jgi:hypothetical protein